MAALPKISSDPDVIDSMALGALRFIDSASCKTVTEGLSVIARVRNREYPAIPSSQGGYIFHKLPGMVAASYWDGINPSHWYGDPPVVPAKYDFNIEVRDTLRRFLPFSFSTKLYTWPEASPICSDGESLDKNIPLFTAPWRLPRNDWVIIRGTLRFFETDKPASWALLRVYLESDQAKPLVDGTADMNGVFMLMFPWPKIDTPPMDTPNVRRWTIRIKAFYDPPAIAEDELPDGDKKLPSLCSILKQQPAKLIKTLAGNGISADEELDKLEIAPDVTLQLNTIDKKVLYLK